MPDEEIKPEEQTTTVIAEPPVVPQTVDPVVEEVQEPLVSDVAQKEVIAEPLKEEPVVEIPTVQEGSSGDAERGEDIRVQKLEEVTQENAEQEERPPQTTIVGTGGLSELSVDLPVLESQSERFQPEVVERVIEKMVEKPLSQEDRDRIYREELTKHLPQMNARKREKYEKHLQDIVNFIREKHTLVSNQDIEEGLNVPDSTVTDRLNELINRGTVMRIGDDKHAKYRLTAGV